MKNRLLLIIVAVLLISLPVMSACAQQEPAPSPTPSPATTPAKVYNWKLQSFCATADWMYNTEIQELVKKVAARSNGRIKIETYPAGAIVSAADSLKAAADNIVQIAHTSPGYWSGIVPVSNAEYGMPMAYEDTVDCLTVMLHRGFLDVLKEEYAKHGVYYMGFFSGEGNKLMTVKPVRHLADLKGKKIRAYGGFAALMEKLGASTVMIPMGEQYMALKLGTIDGSVTGYPVHYDMKHWEIAKYVVHRPWITAGEPLNFLLNMGEWKGLPDDLKLAVELASFEYTLWAGIEGRNFNIKRVDDGMRAQGVEFITLPPDETKQMMAKAIEIWDDWAKKDAACAKAINILKTYNKEKGRID